LPIPPAGPASPGSSGTAGPLPADLSGTSGTKLEFTKPPSSATVTPISGSGNSERVPTTSYDVTIYVPKATDTYESISREFYNDARYATALRTYNRNKVVQGADAIDIPPIYILKRLLQPQSGLGSATGRGGNLPPDWGTANPAAPRSSGGITFRIPQGGMSMRAVARWALGNEQRWTEIYDLNPQHTKPDAILPAGTELKLPADARPPE
jgi:nucleoid-associated protein YgaU